MDRPSTYQSILAGGTAGGIEALVTVSRSRSMRMRRKLTQQVSYRIRQDETTTIRVRCASRLSIFDPGQHNQAWWSSANLYRGRGLLCFEQFKGCGEVHNFRSRSKSTTSRRADREGNSYRHYVSRIVCRNS